MTDPNGQNEPWSAGHDGRSGSAGPPSGAGDGAQANTSGFQVPAQPPIEGYPAPGSGAVGPGGTTGGAYPHPAGPPPGWAYPDQCGGQYPPAGPYPGQPGGQYPGQQGEQFPPAWPYRSQQAGPYDGQPGEQLPPAGPDPFLGQYPAAGPYGYRPSPYLPAGPGGYPVAAPYRPQRPGTVTGAAVLAFVLAGLDLLGGLITIGVSASASASASVLAPSGWATGLLVAALGSLAVGAAMIAGGVLMLRGRPALLFVTGGLTALIAVYWFSAASRWGQGVFVPTVTNFYPLLYVAMAAVMVGLALSRSAQQWCTDRRSGSPQQWQRDQPWHG